MGPLDRLRLGPVTRKIKCFGFEVWKSFQSYSLISGKGSGRGGWRSGSVKTLEQQDLMNFQVVEHEEVLGWWYTQ